MYENLEIDGEDVILINRNKIIMQMNFDFFFFWKAYPHPASELCWKNNYLPWDTAASKMRCVLR